MSDAIPLSLEDANRLCRAHGIGPCLGVASVPNGATNRSYALKTSRMQVFLRIYEQRNAAGVREEHALLEHLAAASVPVPERIPGPPPGELLVQGRPVGLFHWIEGEQPCRHSMTPQRLRQLGETLARAHQASLGGPPMAPAPFGIDEVLSRLADIRAEARQELAPDISRLDQDLQDLRACWPCDLPQGIIHSDLFPDNTFWDGDRLLAVLDWDTAGRGLFAYDLMITLLAWTFGEDFDWSLGHALCAGYTSVRPILDEERAALPVLARAAAVRFSVSRIIQFHLHDPPNPTFWRDYRRFLLRLDALKALDEDEMQERVLS